MRTKQQFDRNEMAKWYAGQHMKTDPGVQAVYYLPEGAPEREIRFLEINDLITDRENDPLEPIGCGVYVDMARAHTLTVLDVSPTQWEKIEKQQLQLPNGWSLDKGIRFVRSNA